MRILLIIPPQHGPFQPLLGVPSITAYLREKGHEVYQQDLNVEAFQYFLSPERLKEAQADTKTIRDTKRAVRALRSPKTASSPSEYFSAISKIEKSLGLISKNYYPARLSLGQNAQEKHSHFSSSGLLKATIDASSNPFIEFFEKKALNRILKLSPQIIGISVSWKSNLFPAFTLARMIKNIAPGIHITMGGSYISALEEYLKRNRRLHKYIDSFVVYEGEISVEKLAGAIKSQQKLSSVPNLIYMKEGKIFYNPPESIALDRLPTPDYDGLPLKDYFSPFPVLPLLTSRGCYWGKCAFCSHNPNYKNLDQRDVGLVIDDIKRLSRKHKTRCFLFNDSCMSPKRLEELSKRLIKNRLNIKCICELRFERALSLPLLKLMSKAGFDLLYFGLESGCQRSQDKMEKGVRIATAEKILREAKKANIKCDISSFIGFPGETKDEAVETFKFFSRNRRFINSMSVGVFQLTKNSRVYNAPTDYGIEKIHKNRGEDLCLSFRYCCKTGMSQEQARQLLCSSCVPKDIVSLYRGREHSMTAAC
ncbi:MAG: B12-binding domain-containing radical SAM protein [Candidatus Margulisbacteria bacterium]|nr:B12-binding domain-containing radical SAM protein [Candidatus Margulisiibacteriota bacterium]